jgi:hypothetical protein
MSERKALEEEWEAEDAARKAAHAAYSDHMNWVEWLREQHWKYEEAMAEKAKLPFAEFLRREKAGRS